MRQLGLEDGTQNTVWCGVSRKMSFSWPGFVMLDKSGPVFLCCLVAVMVNCKL